VCVCVCVQMCVFIICVCVFTMCESVYVMFGVERLSWQYRVVLSLYFKGLPATVTFHYYHHHY